MQHEAACPAAVGRPTVDTSDQRAFVPGRKHRTSRRLPHAPVVLEAKLRVPAIGPDVMPRPRLHARLEGEAGNRVTLVAAPAGFGKTTLLASWVHGEAARARPCAWVALDEADANPARLLAHVRAALRRAVPALGDAAPRAASRVATVAATAALANDLERAGADTVLILDDCHRVTGHASRRVLRFLFEHLPSGVHVVAASRSEAPFRLGRLRATGDLHEIRAVDLRFGVDGARRIVLAGSGSDSGSALGEAELSRLVERTEGWAAGLRLAGLALREHPDPAAFVQEFAGDHRHVRDYLLQEVLRAASPADRVFLLRTSLLDRLCGPLCDAVLATAGSGEVLAAMERGTQLLVALDDRDGWFRYHRLLEEFLRAQLHATEPQLVPELHRRAAGWLRAAGEVDAAIRHAVAGGAYGLAAEAITAQGAIPATQRDCDAVGAWLSLMPDAYLASDPQLAACAAWHARISGAPEPQLRRLIALAAAPDPNRAWVGAARSQAGELALLRMLQPYGDAGAMVRAARDAVHEVAPDDPAVSLALLHLALALMQADRYADARAPLEAVLARDADLGLIERVTAVAFLAAVDAHGGASRAAAARVERALELAGPDLLGTFGSGFALTALADALVVFGEAGRASPLGEAGAGLLAMPAPHVTHAHALLILARCHAGRGDHAGARGRLASVRRAVNGADDARAILRLAGELERTLSPAPAGAVSLTRRELDVLRLLDGELTRREIGATLFVSSNTVKTHLRSIMRKLDATSRAEAVERGLSLGLLPGDAGMAADPLAGRPAATSPG